MSFWKAIKFSRLVLSSMEEELLIFFLGAGGVLSSSRRPAVTLRTDFWNSPKTPPSLTN